MLAESDIERDREAMDLFHAVSTYFEIRESELGCLGPRYVSDLREWTVEKNRKRGYYRSDD
jgi:hypothetical protein